MTLTKVGEVDDTALEDRVRMGALIEEAVIVDEVVYIMYKVCQWSCKVGSRKHKEKPTQAQSRERGGERS